MVLASAITFSSAYADPSLTYQVSGLKNGDSAGSILTGGLNRVAGENVGVYGINQGDLALNRTPVTAVKGRCPRPLDEGDNETFEK